MVEGFVGRGISRVVDSDRVEEVVVGMVGRVAESKENVRLELFVC